MPLASISFHEANKDFKSFTQRKELHQWIFFEHDQQPVLLFSLSLSEPGAFFCRSRQPAFWYSTPANYRADFKDLLIYSCTNPPFPSSQTDSHDAMPWLFSFNCLMSSIVFMHSHIFLLPCGLYSAFLGPEYEKKYQTKNKPMASFSILHCNLIIWYKHFIVSKLFEWFDIEMRSAVFVPSWTQGFPFTRLH